MKHFTIFLLHEDEVNKWFLLFEIHEFINIHENVPNVESEVISMGMVPLSMFSYKCSSSNKNIVKIVNLYSTQA